MARTWWRRWFTRHPWHSLTSNVGWHHHTLEDRITPAASLIISEVFANPSGNDSPYEYVELLATESINFASTPYSVVFTDQVVAPSKGWITGGNTTYGFAISSGSVSKGDVVYVGGSSMVPTGPRLRVLNTDTTDGDRFGDRTSGGVLGNGGSNADSVAVFNLPIASLSDTSVPIDALFFGNTTGNAVVSGGADGYTLPNNDRYSGGFLQTTSFLATNPTTDMSIIADGIYDTASGQFTTPRTWANGTPTDGTTAVTLTGPPPTIPHVDSIVRLNTNPTNASAIDYAVTMSESVTGVGKDDFQLVTTGTISGASVSGVSGSGASYTVSVNTGSGDGTIRLDVTDDNSITNGVTPLGGSGANNGNYNTGDIYTIDHTPPTVTFDDQDSDDLVPINTVVTYTIQFSESVDGLDLTDIINSGTAPITVANLTTIDPATYTVEITPTAGGTLRLQFATSSGVVDEVGNPLVLPALDDTTIIVTAPPSVVSISTSSTNPTLASTVEYVVTFDQPVTGVDVTDFTLISTGVSAYSIGSVIPASGFHDTYTVQVNTGAGSGTLRLNLIDNDSITNATNSPLSGGFSGEMYTMDRTGPTVTIDDDDADNLLGINGSITYTITFNEPVSGVDLLDFSNAGSAPIVFSNFTMVTPGIYTIVGTPGAGGTITLALSPSGSISDHLGNPLNQPARDDDTLIADFDAPTVTFDDGDADDSVIVGNSITYTVTFDEVVTGLGTGDFSNAGSAVIGFGTLTTSDGKTYQLPVTTSGPGTLRLQIIGGTIKDAAGNSLDVPAVDTTTLSVLPMNTAPIAMNDGPYTTLEDEPLIATVLHGLLVNDRDTDNGPQPLTVSTQQVIAPIQGVVAIQPDGSFLYIPHADAFGQDSFTYRITDGELSTTATATINITPVNDPPIAINDGPYHTSENAILSVSSFVGLLANDTDVDSTSLIVTPYPISGPSHGSVEIHADGSFLFTPTAGYSGPDSFTYQVSDGSNVALAVATLTISAVNSSPIAESDTYTLDEDQPLQVEVMNGILANDHDSDGPNTLVVTPILVQPPAHGRLLILPDGSFTYTPDADYFGTDLVRYQVTDGDLTAVGSIILIVSPVNDPPQAFDDSAVVLNSMTPIAIDVLQNDRSDPDHDESLRVTDVTSNTNGAIVRISGSGLYITYQPPLGYVGIDSFTYQLSDGNGGFAEAVVSVTVEAPRSVTPPEPPVLPPVIPAPPPVTPQPPAVPIPPSVTIPVSPIVTAPTPSPVGTPSVEAHPSVIIVGAGEGGSRVRVLNATTRNTLFDFYPYGPAFTGGVRVAAGDLNADGVPDFVVGAGVGGGPHVRLYDGRTGSQLDSPLASFFAFDSSLRNGVWLAVGDVTGDGQAELVVGAGVGGGPHIRVFDPRTGRELQSFFAFDPHFRGGVTVAVGDVNGDGMGDIVAGAGDGGSPLVRVFRGDTLEPLAEFMADDATRRSGVTVAAGDLSGDGIAEIATGVGTGGRSSIRLFNGRGVRLTHFDAYESDFHGSVNVSVVDVDGDDQAWILTGTGPGGGARVRAFSGLSETPRFDLMVFESEFRGGVYVGGAG